MQLPLNLNRTGHGKRISPVSSGGLRLGQELGHATPEGAHSAVAGVPLLCGPMDKREHAIIVRLSCARLVVQRPGDERGESLAANETASGKVDWELSEHVCADLYR